MKDARRESAYEKLRASVPAPQRPCNLFATAALPAAAPERRGVPGGGIGDLLFDGPAPGGKTDGLVQTAASVA